METKIIQEPKYKQCPKCKDTRPVKCFICKKKMYYAEHPKHEREYQIMDNNDFKGYVHVKCLRNKK